MNQVESGRSLPSGVAARTERWINVGVGVYVLLWVFEGAVRKWVPDTAALFYVVRDVLFACSVVLLTLGSTKRTGSARWFWVLSVSISALAIVQVFLGIVNVQVAVLGTRSYLAPALFIAAIAAWGTPRTLGVVQRIILITIPVELMLCALQAFSPARSWVNAQVGSDEASFINFGIVRPSGTFSAPAGLLTFVPLALAFALYKFSERNARSSIIATLLSAASFIIVALSGARGIVLGVAVVVVAYVVCSAAGFRKPSRLPLAPLLTMVLVSATLATVFLSTVLNSFAQRFTDASRSEDPFARLVNQAVGFVQSPITLIGTGPGSRSQVGIAAGSSFGWLEIDNDRWVAELGLLGFILALIRVLAFVWLAVETARGIGRGDWLFVLVSSSFLPTLFSGSLTQTPTAQAGTAVTIAVLLLAHRVRTERTQPALVAEPRRPRSLATR